MIEQYLQYLPYVFGVLLIGLLVTSLIFQGKLLKEHKKNILPPPEPSKQPGLEDVKQIVIEQIKADGIRTQHIETTNIESKRVNFAKERKTKQRPFTHDRFRIIYVDNIVHPRGDHFQYFVVHDRETEKKFLGTEYGGLIEL